jgi:hypothetical protein
MLDALNPAAAGLVPFNPTRVGHTLLLLCKVAIEIIEQESNREMSATHRSIRVTTSHEEDYQRMMNSA